MHGARCARQRFASCSARICSARARPYFAAHDPAGVRAPTSRARPCGPARLYFARTSLRACATPSPPPLSRTAAACPAESHLSHSSHLIPPNPACNIQPTASHRASAHGDGRRAGRDAGRDRGEKSGLGSQAAPTNRTRPPMSRGPELPSVNQLAAIAQDFGLDMTLDDLTNQRDAMRGAIASLRHIDDMPEERPAVAYPRTSGYRPHPDENPYNAWYWRAEIKGADSGPLAGEEIGHQGCGLRGRSADDERRARPRRLRAHHRRHHRDPPARRGRHHRRQDGLRRLLVLRRRPHQRLRPGAQSAQAHACARRLVEGEPAAALAARRRGHGDRRRSGRLDPHPRLLVRRGRAQGDLRPHSLYGVASRST